MTTEKYVAKIRHGYTSVKELEREIFCIKCAKKCYSPAAFALHYDRHLLTCKTSTATSNRCALFTIQELAQAFLLPTWNWSVTTLFFRTCVFSCRFFDSEHICSCTAMAWLRPIVMGKANSTTAPPATGSTLRCTSTTWLTTAEETPSTKASRTKWS